MDRVYALRGDKSKNKPQKEDVNQICAIYKSCCNYDCCIGNERQYSNNTPMENSPNFEIIYKTLLTYGLEEGLIRTFERMPECIELYRDVIKYYKLKQVIEPQPKEHDKINKVYELIWANKTSDEPPVVWVQRGVIQVYKQRRDLVYLIAIVILQLRKKIGKHSLLLSRLHSRSSMEFVDTHGHMLSNHCVTK
jgi:hypothetical protein